MKAHITSTGAHIVGQQGVKRQIPAAHLCETPKSPSDSFQSSASTAPLLSQETSQSSATVAPAESKLVTAPALETPSKPEVLNNSPGLLTIFDEGEVLGELAPQGVTLAQLAKSATQSIGRGLSRLFVGDQLKPFKAELEAINAYEQEMSQLLTPEQFAAKTAEFKARLAAGESIDKMRPEAYAVAREAAKQETGMFAYDCQVLGALAMDDGHIAEMRTGEGKTLTAVLPLYLNALAGKGAHLVTVNETLAQRDAEWMGPIFEKLGMTVGCVAENQSTEEKRAGYNCDVTYVSDRALGFDFLRDRGAMDPSERVQRGHFFALIDEVDEVLIDEARTPMILSGPSGESSPDYQVFSQIVKKLVPGEDFKLDEEKNSVWLTDGGLRFVENELTLREAKQALEAAQAGSEQAKEARSTMEKATQLQSVIRGENKAQKVFEDLDYHKPNPIARAIGMNGEYDSVAASLAETKLRQATEQREQLASQMEGIDLYREENLHRVHYLDASLKAHTLYSQGKNYTIENGEIKIVDQNKGRVSEGKRYSSGLHQALEAKEGLSVRAQTKTISKITMPELIAQYERKSGMTGTGKTSEGEFIEFYGLDVVEIPTNKPVIRLDRPDVVFASKEAKNQKVVAEAIKAAEAGRPVLVGTVSVNANRDIAARLLNSGWPADRLQILNAESVKGGEDFHDSNAGRSGTITLTTGERAENVKHDPVNYKKLAFDALQTAGSGKTVLLDTDSQEDAEQVQAWLAGSVAVRVGDDLRADATGVHIRVRKSSQQAAPAPSDFHHLDARDYAVEKPLQLTLSEENSQDTLSKALQAFTQGQPVILKMANTQLLGQAAEQLMDSGLGLEAIPMVCDGKEKENVMIEMAGRSGVITVATNMAGRGANIKPDLVAISKISEAAYQKATQGEAVTISVKKKDQATKIQRLMKEFIPVSVAEGKEQKAQAGQVLIRVEKEVSPINEGTLLKGSDFATGGLLVIGTERASSRRVDDQLIGRAGRQGAEGESQFFLSLEDDVPRIFGGENFEPLLSLFGSSAEGVSKDFVNALMSKAQSRVEGQHFEQRQNSSKYDKVSRVQRETLYSLRESVLTGEENSVALAADYGAQGLADLLRRDLGGKRKVSVSEVNASLQKLSQDMKIPLVSLPEGGSLKAEQLDELMFPQVEKLLDNPNLSEDKLRRVVLGQIDAAWQEHLEVMDSLRDGIHLEAMAGREPEEVFAERGFEVFQEMTRDLKTRMASNILPAAARLAKSPA